jgi:hypothetical protein
VIKIIEYLVGLYFLFNIILIWNTFKAGYKTNYLKLYELKNKRLVAAIVFLLSFGLIIYIGMAILSFYAWLESYI